MTISVRPGRADFSQVERELYENCLSKANRSRELDLLEKWKTLILMLSISASEVRGAAEALKKKREIVAGR